MAGNGTQKAVWQWTKARARAAMLCAEDELTDEQIAAEVKIGKRTLATWKTHPEFRARVDSHIAEITEQVRKEGLGRLDKRMRVYEMLHELMLRVIRERGEADPGKVPGGGTGLLVKTIKIIGAGKNQTTIEEYQVDTGLLRELREYMKLLAQDAGQFANKVEMTGADGGAIEIEHAVSRLAETLGITVEELQAETESMKATLEEMP